jgi:integrase
LARNPLPVKTLPSLCDFAVRVLSGPPIVPSPVSLLALAGCGHLELGCYLVGADGRTRHDRDRDRFVTSGMGGTCNANAAGPARCWSGNFGWPDNVVRAKNPKRLPVVFSPEKAIAVLGQLQGVRWLMGVLLYGAGLRLAECLRLSIKDLDFEPLQITVRDAKGEKDRVTLLPAMAVDAIKEHFVRVRQQHERALREGYGGVESRSL